MVHANRTDSRAENPPRVGFVVSKAVGGAVVRNRVKRQLRAASRPLVAELPTGVDLVVRAQPAASEASYQTLAHELMSLSHKAVRQLRMSA